MEIPEDENEAGCHGASSVGEESSHGLAPTHKGWMFEVGVRRAPRPSISMHGACSSRRAVVEARNGGSELVGEAPGYLRA